KRHWIALLWQNRASFWRIIKEAFQEHRRYRRGRSDPPSQGAPVTTDRGKLRPDRAAASPVG
ncbi:MAG: hypothetical protein OXD30_04025, partial [Bryobacterales bacterium]|nr:hypothetical protein [Bryobacterales bacterium]